MTTTTSPNELASKIFKPIPYLSASAKDLEALILAVYDRKYNILNHEEVPGDDLGGTLQMDICKDTTEVNLNYIEQMLTPFISGKDSDGIITYLMRDMCNRGIIQPGCYSIDFCWG